MPFFYFDYYYLLLVVPALIIAMVAQIKVQSTYKKYAQVGARSGITAYEMTRRMLDANGLTHVDVVHIGGNLPEGVSAIGNMEGKESRFGAGTSALWAVATTSASNGSVNAMHDSFTSLGGMIPMFLMMLGEIVYGGVGCGLYGMIAFAILTVFIGGLMVGRTPEYIGKKIGSYDMKMVCLIILTPVLCLLIGTASTVMIKEAPEWLTNSGAHGFSEILYAFASMAGNNGSAFAGLNANTPWTNVTGGIVMLLVRFVPMFAALGLAGSLGNKKMIPQSDGTLSTNNAMFVGLVIAVILIVGALSFFPALALGPIAEFVG